MAGQAGWYHAPGEHGLLRYWNGAAWTHHRQPLPPQAPAPDMLVHQAPQTSQLASLFGTEPTAPARRDGGDLARKRRRLIASTRWMLAGLAIILLGGALVFFAASQPVASSGRSETLGIITSLGAAGGGCRPTAQFAAAGGSYSATSGAGTVPCTFELGQSVSVEYEPARPGSSGRIMMPSLIDQYSWVVPVAGLVVLVLAVLIFIIRAGSIASGVTIIREGAPARTRRTRTDAADSAR